MASRDEQPATVPPPAGEDDAYSAATKVGAMPAEVMAKLRAEGLLPDEEEMAAERRPAPRPPNPFSPRTPIDPNAPVPMLYSTAPPAPLPLEEEDEKTTVATELPIPEPERLPAFPPAPTHQAVTAPPPPNHPPPEAAELIQTPMTFAAPTPPPASTPRTGTTPIEFSPMNMMAVGAAPPSSSMPAAAPPPPSGAPPPASSMAPQFPPNPGPPAMMLGGSAAEDRSLERDVRAFGGRAPRKKSQTLGIVIAVIAIVVGLLFAMALFSHRR